MNNFSESQKANEGTDEQYDRAVKEFSELTRAQKIYAICREFDGLTTYQKIIILEGTKRLSDQQEDEKPTNEKR